MERSSQNGLRLSIVIAVLDSHEALRRQLLWFKGMRLPSDVEIIIVDDGSDPSLTNACGLPNCYILATRDKRPWTQGLARMRGIDAARSEYVFCTDIDHILSKEAIEFGRKFKGDKAIFQRRFAYLDELGELVRDKQKVIEWGANPKGFRDKELSDGFHMNTWLMRKSLFEELGGYNLERCNSGSHLQNEDKDFNHRFEKHATKGKCKAHEVGPPIYFFPSGRYHVRGEDNPHELFHKLEHTKWQKT
jgi:hypothetical protein